ncbi:MAG: hypothetical protein ACP5US_11375 [Candidatus Kryptoniota bacterium]
MRSKSDLYFAVIILVVPLLISIGISAFLLKGGFPAFGANPQNQVKVGDRNWLNVKLTLVNELKNDRTHVVYPSRLRVDGSGNLYILDEGIPGVLKISPEGKYLFTYGNGKGKGPGEFEKPHDMDICPSGLLLVLDASSGTISEFSSNGKFLRTVRPNGVAIHVAAIDDTSFVVQRMSIKDIFAIYKDNGGEIASFGDVSLFESEKLPIPIIDIYLLTSGKTIFAIGGNVSRLLSFDLNGNEQYSVDLIDKVPMPEALMGNKKNIGGREVTEFSVVGSGPVVLDACIRRNKIYLLSYPATHKYNVEVIDRYSSSNGSYEASLKFSKPGGTLGVASFAINDNYLYTLDLLKDGNYVIRKYLIVGQI